MTTEAAGRGNSQGRASLVLKVANALSVESGVFPYPVTDVINKNISGSPTNGEDGRSVRTTDYPVGGATRAAVLAIGRQANTVYAFQTFPPGGGGSANRPPHPPLFANLCHRRGRRRRRRRLRRRGRFRGLPTQRDNQTQTRGEPEDSTTGTYWRRASGGILLLLSSGLSSFALRVLRSLSCLGARCFFSPHSLFYIFHSCLLFACCSSLGRLTQSSDSALISLLPLTVRIISVIVFRL